MLKLNKIKIIVILLATMSILSIIYISIQNQKVTNIQYPDQIVSFPEIPNSLTGEDKLDFDFSKLQESDIPSELPFYIQTPGVEITKQNATDIANNLGFSFEPNTIQDIKNGNIYIWSGDEYSLQIIPTERKILYSTNNSPRTYLTNSINKPFSDEELLQYAKTDISTKLKIDSENLFFLGYRYLEIESGYELFKEVLRENAELIQLNFSTSPSTYPIITSDPNKTEIYAHYTKNGKLTTLEANLSNNLKSGDIKYKTRSISEIKENIAKSMVVDISNVNISDIKSEDIGRIYIQKISIAYLLLSPHDNYLQPVFLIEGNTNIRGYNEQKTIKLYLPALAGTI